MNEKIIKIDDYIVSYDKLKDNSSMLIVKVISGDEIYVINEFKDADADILIQLFNNLENKNDTLNKGIEELIEKYKIKTRQYDKYIEIEPMDLYLEIIKDLKKLKGE